MRPQDAFDICHERFVEARVLLDHKITAINPAACAKSSPKAALPKVAEYVSDFQIMGLRALEAKKNWRKREVLFLVYFCHLVPYKDAIRVLKMKPGTFDWWSIEIKKTVGQAFLTKKLFPPYRYFREPTWLREKRDREENNGEADSSWGADPGASPKSTTSV